jgi:hypothetical protein
VIDFEKSLINAVKICFPNTKTNGCYFHFCQSLYRKIQSFKLCVKYKENDGIREFIRKCMLLSYVPCHDVILKYKSLKEKLNINERTILNDFLQYFEKVYIGNNNFMDTTPTGYGIEFWNNYESVVENYPRTTNYAERWNRTFNDRLFVIHPNIAHFISILKQEESIDKFDIERSKKEYIN